MASTAKNWYIAAKGKKVGPVSEQNLITYYEQKRITGDTKVVKAGMKEWIPLSKSGILAPEFDDDGLPPLPEEDQNHAKKSGKGTTIAVVVVGAVALAMVVALVVAIVNRNNNSVDTADSYLNGTFVALDSAVDITLTFNGDGKTVLVTPGDAVIIDKHGNTYWVSPYEEIIGTYELNEQDEQDMTFSVTLEVDGEEVELDTAYFERIDDYSFYIEGTEFRKVGSPQTESPHSPEMTPEDVIEFIGYGYLQGYTDKSVEDAFEDYFSSIISDFDYSYAMWSLPEDGVFFRDGKYHVRLVIGKIENEQWKPFFVNMGSILYGLPGLQIFPYITFAFSYDPNSVFLERVEIVEIFAYADPTDLSLGNYFDTDTKVKDFLNLIYNVSTESDTHTTSPNMTGSQIEAEVERIRELWQADRAAMDANRYTSRTISGGGVAYFDGALLKMIEVARETGFVANSHERTYSRTYQYHDGNLIFAYFTEATGGDAHRLYFKDGWLFRWRYTPNNSRTESFTDYDLRDDLWEYNYWQELAQREAAELYAS